MFNFDLSDLLKLKIRKLLRKDSKKGEIINKKIKEIINCNSTTIEHYKNLKYNMKDLKRFHIDKHFALSFKVYKKDNFILFLDFDHHNKIYKKYR